VWHADDRALGDRGVLEQHALHLGGVHVLPAGDVHVLQRSTMYRCPSGPRRDVPEWNQPSVKAAAVAAGSPQ